MPEPTSYSGWDVGIVGMKAGGEREMTIPAPMAYGKKRTSGIPPNSTLKFGQFPFQLPSPGHCPDTSSNPRGQTHRYQLGRKRLSAERSDTKKYHQLCVLVPYNIIGGELLSRDARRRI